MSHHLVEVGVVPDGDHLGATAGQRPELVALEAEVDGDDPDSAKAPDPTAPEHSELQLGGERLIPAPPGLGLGDLGHQVAIADPGRPAGQVHLRLRGERRGDGQHPAEGAAVAEMAGERAGVDPAQPGHALAAQLLVEGAIRRGVSDSLGELPDDQRTAVHPAGLGVVVPHPVVPDQRVGHDHHLARVRRIGADLLIPGHAGVEDDLTRRRRAERGTEEPPLVDEGAVDQGHQHPPMEPRPEQGRVLGAGTEVRRFHGPFGRRIEEDTGGRFADAQPGFADAGRLAEHPVGPDGEAVHQGGNPVSAHPSEGDADRERQLQSDHPRSRPIVRQRLLLDPMGRVVGRHRIDHAVTETLDQRLPVTVGAERGIHLEQAGRLRLGREGEPHPEVMRGRLGGHVGSPLLGPADHLHAGSRRHVLEVNVSLPGVGQSP